MKTKMRFILLVAIWLMMPRARPIAATVCTGAGALVRDNWTQTMAGWYCDISPGASEHTCTFDQLSMCESACSDCGKVYVSTNYCTYQRTEGPAPTDQGAVNLGCSGQPGFVQWGEKYEASCNCATSEEDTCDDEWCWSQGGVCYEDLCTYGSPIVIPTNDDESYHLTDIQGGVFFDIFGTGVPRQVAWTRANEPLAFLAIDRNHDGVVSGAVELFGNHSIPGADNGFEVLRLLEHSNPEYIDVTDPEFAKLLLWTDSNHNGFSDAGEVQRASKILTRIGLDYRLDRRKDRFGNQFRYRGWAQKKKKDGGRTTIFDVVFQTVR
jgi:hypothetical protein